MVKKTFLIGNLCFSLTYPAELIPPANFLIFEDPEGQPEYDYTISLASSLPKPKGKLIVERSDIRIFEKNGLENRLIGIKGREEFYAYYQEVSETAAEVVLNAEIIAELNCDPMFVSLLALERRLIQKEGLILHCAYLCHQGESILFSAPSETGKTTQANLWEQHRGSETVNGDRALLQQVNGRWTAQGWPVCGTSEICQNRAIPIRAIVMLSQSKEDRVRRLSPIEAFSQLYSQITVNTWNRSFVGENMRLIDHLIGQVPVYHLACTISEQAVSCLEAAIYGGSTA